MRTFINLPVTLSGTSVTLYHIEAIENQLNKLQPLNWDENDTSIPF